MKTKVTILGTESKECKKLKPIEFVEHIIPRIKTFHRGVEPITKPHEWSKIILISPKMGKSEYDVMFAYDRNDTSTGAIFLGHFNDGVVE